MGQDWRFLHDGGLCRVVPMEKELVCYASEVGNHLICQRVGVLGVEESTNQG